MGKDQHVLRRQQGGWMVKAEGGKKATAITKTQKEAIERAKIIAKNQKAEVVIHGLDNKILDKDSYGSDPCPPKDKKH